MYILPKCIIVGILLYLLPVVLGGQVVMPCDREKAEDLFTEEDYSAAIAAFECLLEQETDKPALAQIYYMLGKAHSRLSVFRTAIVNFNWSMKLLEEAPNEYLEAKVYSGIAYAHNKMGDFQQAYAFQMEALKIAETNRDEKNISRSVYQLGNYAQSVENFPQALEHYLRVKEMISDTTKSKYAVLMGAIGSVYVEMGQLEKGVDYLQKSAGLSAEQKNLTTLAYALGNLGEAHAEMGQFELAVDYIGTAIDRKQELGDQTGVLDSKLQLGQLWMDQKRYARAEAIFMEAVQEAEKLGAKKKLLEGFLALKTLFAENGQYEKAYGYLDQYTKLKEEILDENIVELIEEHNLLYQTTEKEAEIRRLKDIQAERDKNYHLKLIVAISCLALLVTLIVVGYQVNRSLSRKNASLAEFGKRLAEKNKDLEHFAHIASHDMKEPLRTISSFTSLLGKKYVQQLDDQAQVYMGFIQQSVINMRTLLDDLLDYARADKPGGRRIPVNSKQLLDTALSNLNAQIKKKEASVCLNKEALPELEVVPSQVIQLFQNLIGNALKFSNKDKPVIQVDCKPQSGGYHRFSVTDEGIGIAAEDQQKIFEMFSRLHHEQAYKGSGIGLATCKKIVDQYGGRIWVESELGKGATFHFTLPHAQNEKSRTV